MYQMIKGISIIIRQYMLPNPFLNYFQNEGMAELFNWIFGSVILGTLAYTTTGIYYRKNSNSFVGSLSFLAWYYLYNQYFIFVGNHIKNFNLVLFILIVIISLTYLVVFYVTQKIMDIKYYYR